MEDKTDFEVECLLVLLGLHSDLFLFERSGNSTDFEKMRRLSSVCSELLIAIEDSSSAELEATDDSSCLSAAAASSSRCSLRYFSWAEKQKWCYFMRMARGRMSQKG